MNEEQNTLDMTRNYTESIPVDLAKKLYKAGMPIETSADDEWWCPPYAEVFDWLMEKGISIELAIWYNPFRDVYDFNVDSRVNGLHAPHERYPSWTEAATAAIEKALEILNEEGGASLRPRP